MRVGLLLGLLATVPAWGWGNAGHRVIAQIAENHLDPKAAQAVRDLLGHESLAAISNWADEARSTKEWSYTAPWHYVNFKPDEHDYETIEKNPDGDVVTGTRWSEEILRDPQSSREDRIVALKFLVHFIGDIHQPMHTGRLSDRGGNEVDIRWMGRATNLHSIWDTRLISAANLSVSGWVRLLDRPTARQLRQWQSTGITDWVNETRALVDACYDFDEDASLGYPYFNEHLPTVKAQLLKAGIRLAGALNSIFTAE